MKHHNFKGSEGSPNLRTEPRTSRTLGLSSKTKPRTFRTPKRPNLEPRTRFVPSLIQTFFAIKYIFTIMKNHNDINFSLSSFAIYWVVKSHVFVERLNEFIVVCKCFELIQTVSARVTRFVSNGGSFSKMNLGGQHVTTLKGTIYVLLSHTEQTHV